MNNVKSIDEHDMNEYEVTITKKCHYKVNAKNYMEALKVAETSEPYITESFNHNAKLIEPLHKS